MSDDVTNSTPYSPEEIAAASEEVFSYTLTKTSEGFIFTLKRNHPLLLLVNFLDFVNTAIKLMQISKMEGPNTAIPPEAEGSMTFAITQSYSFCVKDGRGIFSGKSTYVGNAPTSGVERLAEFGCLLHDQELINMPVALNKSYFFLIIAAPNPTDFH